MGLSQLMISVFILLAALPFIVYALYRLRRSMADNHKAAQQLKQVSKELEISFVELRRRGIVDVK